MIDSDFYDLIDVDVPKDLRSIVSLKRQGAF